MRQAFILVSFVAFFLMIPSCNEVIVEELPDGFGHEIVLNQEKLEFSSRGGEVVVRCTNLPMCCISELEDKLADVFYHPEKDEQNNPTLIKCECIVVTTLDKASATVKVAESDKPHHWVLSMRSGNSYKDVDIVQK